MRKIYFGSLLFVIISCRQHETDKERRQLLQGDWVSWTGQGSLPGPWFIASFEDSLMTLGAHGNFVKYELRGDSLLPDAKVDMNIFKLTRDSLIIGVYYEDEIRNDSFRLSKVSAKNSLVPVKLLFASSGCFGSCQSMALEIDSSGEFIFWGGVFTKKEGFYSGQLTVAQYQQILTRVRQLPLDSLKEKYEADWTDDQTAGIVIITNDKQIESAAYGFDKEPVELRILFHKLSELYKTVPLKPDSTIQPDYFYRYNILKLPPPPRIEPPGKRG